MADQYYESFTLRTWDVDQADRLTPAAIANFFQEVAGTHAQKLGVGIEPFRAANQAWILSRLSFDVSRRPGRGAVLTVGTWPRGTQRLFVIRDYEIHDETGACLVAGRSGWLIVDQATLRPKRPESLVTGMPANIGRDALPDGAGAVPVRNNLTAVGRRSAAYSDIDYYGHVNNARYLQWLQDALPADALAAAAGFRLDINFLAEVKAGQEIELLAALLPAGPEIAADKGTAAGKPPTPNCGWTMEGRHVAGNAAFRAELRLR